jgi:glycosyltransferase involved in cell wall biosynthesis
LKILVVHQYYLRPGQPGGSRFNEMCRLWSEAGHEVQVIAGTLNYVTGETPAEYRGRWMTKEMDGDVTVYRCRVPSTYHSGRLGRLFAFIGFVLSGSTAALRVKRPDLVIATSPPLTAIVPGWIAARFRLRRAKLIFEVRDLWPETWVLLGTLRRTSVLARLLYFLERWASRTSDRINVLTPAFREDMVTRGVAPAGKIVFIPNGADVESFRPATRDNEMRRALGWGDRTVVLYAGAHGVPNALGQLIDAAIELRSRPDILIACVGDGIERAALEARVKEEGLTNIIFHGAQPKEQMPAIVNACDIGTAVLANNISFHTVYPNKVFDYMACERPVLIAIDGVARDLVCNQANAGIFAEPENPKAIAGAIRRLADDSALRAELARNGRAWVLANATRDALAARYLGVMHELTGR